MNTAMLVTIESGRGTLHAKKVAEKKTMQTFKVRFVHKVSPKDTDTMPDIELNDDAFNTRVSAGQALRNAKVLGHGCSVRQMRTENDGRIVVFPTCPNLTTYWHSIILTPVTK